MIETRYEDIEKYLAEVKKLVKSGNYRIDTNAKRQDNRNLYTEYVIDEALSKEILLELEVTDFSEIVNNKNPGFEHEKLYIFGKTVKLVERFGDSNKEIMLYIKFNKIENVFLVVISFHECKYPLNYLFR